MLVQKWVKRILSGILLTVLLLLLSGFIYEQAARLKAEKITPHGRFIDVGGHQLHFYQKGEQGPTVVFESAWDPSGHLQWFKIQDKVSQFATTISYDRAGILWSERGSNPKTGKAIAKELHTMLEKSGASKPYILVAHSLGAVVVRSFINDYKSDVAGVLLVDSKIPNEEDYISSELYETVNQGMPEAFMKLANSVGVVRLMFSDTFPDKQENSYLRSLMPALIYRSVDALFEEQAKMPELCKEASKISSFGDIPLIVLNASDRNRLDGYFTSDSKAQKMKETFLEALDKMHQDELSLSTNSEQILVPNSSHYINEDQPEILVNAIKKLIETTNVN